MPIHVAGEKVEYRHVHQIQQAATRVVRGSCAHLRNKKSVLGIRNNSCNLTRDGTLLEESV